MGLPAELPQVDYLPPPEARLIDPDRDNIDKLQTPVDGRGLVDVRRLIAIVKNTVDPAYRWPTGESLGPNVHHLYWPRASYPLEEDGSMGTRKEFRELPVNKAMLPAGFHNWLHIIVEPPPVPDMEIMEYRIEAWHVASSLLQHAHKIAKEEKKKRGLWVIPDPGQPPADIDEEIMQEILASHFPEWEEEVERLHRIPLELRLLKSVDNPRRLAHYFNRYARRQHLSLVGVVTG